jgi:hypothetical protein
MTVLITRVELNAAALGALLLVAVPLGAQPTWAAETQTAAPSPSEATQTDEPSPEKPPTDHPAEQRLGPLARRLQEVIFADDSRVTVPQSQAHLDQMLHAPEGLHIGLDFRTRYESYSQPVKKNETTGGAQFSERTDVNVEARYKPFKFHAEFLDARPLYNYGVTVSNRMEDENDLLQLYASVGTDNFLGSGLPTELQIGKFTQTFGKGRLIARSNYSNVPYSFVGAHWTLGTRKDWELRAFVMRPIQNQQTSPDFVAANTLFSGMSYLDQRMSWVHTELYLYYITQNEEAQGSNGINQDQGAHGQVADLYTPGFRLFKPEARGAFDYEIESDYQFGRSAPNPGGPLLTTFAFFQHGEVGYTFAVPWTPSLRFMYDYASGDSNPNDNKNGRFNPLLGTQNFPFTYTGIWSLFKQSNINSPGYLVSMQPLKDLQAIFKQRFWWLAQSKDEFIGAGLQDQTGRAGKYVGSELDLRLAWTVGPNMLVEGGWLYFIKGSYYSNLLKEAVAGAPNDKNTDYVFLSMRLFF